MLMRLAIAFLINFSLAEARVVRLMVEHREPVLNGKPFGLAGAYEKLSGKVQFALDPASPANSSVIDLALAPRNPKGEVEFTADFILLKPTQGNGRLLYEVGNRGGKALLRVFQKGGASADPTSASDFGDGALMNQGYTLLWMGWQWDVPEGRMRMDMPVASDHGAPITGLVRGNFVPNARSGLGPLSDRGHRAYPVNDMKDPEAFMTVRDHSTDTPTRIPREKWRFVDDVTVALDSGFEPGRIYDVVYRAREPRVLGCGLAGTRDLISYLKDSKAEGNPVSGIKFAYGWGVSQSGRFLRHLLYEGFNADEQGRQVFDGVIDEVGGAGRGSFNHRFGQASRDAEQFFNFHFPVDMFPFTDGPETDPETSKTDSLLKRAEAANVAPKIFHILSNSEYFNRAGSLIHTDPAGTRDIDPPANARIYMIAAGPHYFGPFPPVPSKELAAGLSPLDRSPVVRALLKAMDAWVVDRVAPPESRYPKIADGTLKPPAEAGWPKIPGVKLPPPMLMTYRLDFGPDFAAKGLVTFEPPKIGKAFVGLVPAVDEDGNAKAGIRMPLVAAPIATYSGWNFRTPQIGSPDQLNGEAGAFYPFARTKAERSAADSRKSIEERYTSREQYLGKVIELARVLMSERLWLAEDLPDLVDQAVVQYDWAVGRR